MYQFDLSVLERGHRTVIDRYRRVSHKSELKLADLDDPDFGGIHIRVRSPSSEPPHVLIDNKEFLTMIHGMHF